MADGGRELNGLVPHNQAAEVEVVCPDDAGCCAFVAVSNLPAAALGVGPRGAFPRVENSVAAITTYVCR